MKTTHHDICPAAVDLTESDNRNSTETLRTDEFAAPPGYLFLEEIGRGGMGVVFRALDIRLDRHVAIKMLQNRDNPVLMERFFRSEQIMAQLQHPGIPSVHEMGTNTRGQPYLVMKWVQGETLEHLVQSRNPIRVRPLFESLARTLAYAHSQGIIHRDLKPSNIMVGEFGEVQVLDWGIAKRWREAQAETATAEVQSLKTVVGTMLGTLAYIPPEQANRAFGEDGPWSDVFGLGGILMYLLTGKPPYVANSLEELKQKAREADLGDAHTLLDQQTTDSDLASLAKSCLTAMHRYRPQNAQRLCHILEEMNQDDDLRKKQIDRAKIEANTRREELEKRQHLQRNVALVVSLVMIASMGVATHLMLRARQAEAQATRQRDLARDAERLALSRQESEAQAKTEASEQARFATQTKEFLQNVLKQSTAEGQATLTRRANPNISLREALVHAAKQLEETTFESSEIEADLRSTLGISFLQLRHLPEAHRQLERAYQLRRSNAGLMDQSTADALMQLSSLRWHEGHYSLSGDYARRAAKVFEEIHGADHERTLRAKRSIGLALASGGKHREAEAVYLDVLHQTIRILGPDHLDVHFVEQNLGLIYMQTQQFEKADQLYQHALAGREKHYGPQHPSTLIVMNNIAGLRQAQSRSAEAEAIFKIVLERREQTLGSEHADTITSLNNLAGLYMITGQVSRAQPLLERVHECRMKQFGPLHPDTILSVNNLGGVAYEQQKYTLAKSLFEKACLNREKLLGEEHPDTLAGMKNVANAARAAGDRRTAERYFRRAYEIAESIHFRPLSSRFIADNYARFLEQQGDELRAYAVRRRWIQHQKLQPKPEVILAYDHLQLAGNHLRLGRLSMAKSEALEARRLAAVGQVDELLMLRIESRIAQADCLLGDERGARKLQDVIERLKDLRSQPDRDDAIRESQTSLLGYLNRYDPKQSLGLRRELDHELAPRPRESGRTSSLRE
jgi:eukaryotic-like serine/threonine-protein kinase